MDGINADLAMWVLHVHASAEHTCSEVDVCCSVEIWLAALRYYRTVRQGCYINKQPLSTVLYFTVGTRTLRILISIATLTYSPLVPQGSKAYLHGAANINLTAICRKYFAMLSTEYAAARVPTELHPYTCHLLNLCRNVLMRTNGDIT